MPAISQGAIYNEIVFYTKNSLDLMVGHRFWTYNRHEKTRGLPAANFGQTAAISDFFNNFKKLSAILGNFN